jgi:hypothetical protein
MAGKQKKIYKLRNHELRHTTWIDGRGKTTNQHPDNEIQTNVL